MPCTAKKTFASAARTGNALLVRLKANQPGLHEAVAGLCAGQDPVDRYETTDRGRHGRQEHRRVEVFVVAGWLPPGWQGVIACAARVWRLSWCKDTRTGRPVAPPPRGHLLRQPSPAGRGELRARRPGALGGA